MVAILTLALAGIPVYGSAQSQPNRYQAIPDTSASRRRAGKPIPGVRNGPAVSAGVVRRDACRDEPLGHAIDAS